MTRGKVTGVGAMVAVSCIWLCGCSSSGDANEQDTDRPDSGAGTDTDSSDDTDGNADTDTGPPIGAVIATVTLTPQSDSTVPTEVSFGHLFVQGDIPANAHLEARDELNRRVPLQLDRKTTHADGSLRHGVVTVQADLASRAQRQIELVLSEHPPDPGHVTTAALLTTDWDVVVSVVIDGTHYTASPRAILNESAPAWLRGNLVSEWQVAAPLTSASGPHPHLEARFGIRAYRDILRVRTSVTVENTSSFTPQPQNYLGDVSVTVAGQVALLEEAVTHYRQARWRRLLWWGTSAEVHVTYDLAYMVRTGAIPHYDPVLQVPEPAIVSLVDEWNDRKGLMQSGLMSENMPGVGGRGDIGPLPLWAAYYLISQDARVQEAMVGTGEQAGSWPIHYRDETTGQPISLDTYPDLAVLGSEPFFPDCGGDCDSPYEPDVAHQPAVPFVPYVITGDWFHLEELHFWANWNAFYWGDHGGSLGLVVHDQLRAQAWGLRSLTQAAWITPDDHPQKKYFAEKLGNNLHYYQGLYVDGEPNSFGHAVAREDDGGAIAFWQDDFFTWVLGYAAVLGFEQAEAIHDFKTRFVIGRLTHPDYCWIMASVYWARVSDGATGISLFSNWQELYRAMVVDDPESIRPQWLADLIRADSDAFLNAPCGGDEMGAMMDAEAGTMIGYPTDPESYTMNISPALAIAVDRQVPGAAAAWQRYAGRANEYAPPLAEAPHWAIVPRKLD